MRRLLLPFMLFVAVAAPNSSASGACEHALAAHGVGLVLSCDISGHGVIVVAGNHQSAECPRSDGNLVVIVGDHNEVNCRDSLLTDTRSSCQGEPYAVEVMGEAHSCGLTIVLLGSGSGRMVVVGVGKAEGGSVAIVGHGCATQNEEGLAMGVASNTCGPSILPGQHKES